MTMRLVAWLAFVTGLFTCLVWIVRLLPLAYRGLGFLGAAVAFYSITLLVSLVLAKEG